MQDVAVGDRVLRAFDPQLAGILGALLTAAGDVVVIGDHFGADEALFEIGMNGAGGLRRFGTFAYRPGVRLLGADREEGDEIEEGIAGANDPRLAGFR